MTYWSDDHYEDRDAEMGERARRAAGCEMCGDVHELEDLECPTCHAALDCPDSDLTTCSWCGNDCCQACYEEGIDGTVCSEECAKKLEAHEEAKN